jgi:hypothetical protein
MLKEYQTHSELNPAIWKDGELLPKLRAGFMKIAEKFYEFLEIDAPILDVILIGSNANYNWTKYSDIDLHVVINYMEVGDNLHMTKNYLHLKKALWNHEYPLKYKGINIELYAQDANEDLHSSVGIYSIAHNKWINRPKADLISIDDSLIQMKAEPFEYEITNLKQNHPNLEKRIREILLRLRNLRQAGLEAEGEYSIENLAFKYLRNKGLIDRLKELLHLDTVKHLTFENVQYESVSNMLAKHVMKEKIMTTEDWHHVMKHTNAVHDAMGQWKHPGKCTMIPSNQITMKQVPHQVLGIDDTGHMQLMKPEQSYTFPGTMVFEIPRTPQWQTMMIQLVNKVRNGGRYAK